MRRILALMLAMIMLLSLTACDVQKSTTAPTTEPVQMESKPTTQPTTKPTTQPTIQATKPTETHPPETTPPETTPPETTPPETTPPETTPPETTPPETTPPATQPSQAYSQGLEFKLNSDSASYCLVGIGTCTDADVIIPPEHEGLPVTSIQAYAFAWQTDLVSIIFPDSIAKVILKRHGLDIGDSGSVFYGCENLVFVDLGDGLTELPARFFRDCYKLTDVILPKKLKEIQDSAFENCTNLASIVIPEGVILVGLMAFGRCTSLTEVTLPSSVAELYPMAFHECTSLIRITFQGTMAQWETVYKPEDGGWDADTGDYTVYCTDGEIKKGE